MVDGAATLQVSDTGLGMDEETRRRVFEPFFTTKPQGQGLGTSIVENIVTRHGGTVTVTSRPGAGTTFGVVLQPLRDGVPAVMAVPEAAPGGNAPPARVLLIDDDDNVRETIEAALLCGGHTVEAFAQAQPALEALARGGFDLVVTDLTMPHITGLDVARAVKRDHPGLPVVLLTGCAAARDDWEAQQAGVAHILAKPCPMSELLATVSALVAASASRGGQAAEEIAAP
jgi:CheY-like chemotaxis protein